MKKSMTKACPRCGGPIDSGWMACPACGTDLHADVCNGCGKEMKSEWKACPYCGRHLYNDDVPNLPDEDELDEGKGPSAGEKAKAQRLLDQLEAAIAEYAREIRYKFGKGFAMLFGVVKAPSPEKCFSLRDQIYEAIDDHEARYDGPFWEMMCSKKKMRNPDDLVTIFRKEVSYIATHLSLTAKRSASQTASADKFICPGCGEKATAKNASLCPNCNQYVHHDCAVKGLIRWSCPVCGTGLVGQT